MRKIVTEHPEFSTIVSAVISIILALFFLLNNGLDFRDILNGDVNSLLTIAAVGCATTIGVLYTLNNRYAKAEPVNNKMALRCKRAMVVLPFFFFFVFCTAFLIIKDDKSCRNLSANKADELAAFIENRTELHLPVYLVHAAIHNQYNSKSIIEGFDRYQQALADSLLLAVNDSLDAPCRKTLKDELNSILAIHRSKTNGVIEEIVGITIALQKAISENDIAAVDELMQRYNISFSADVFEYETTFEDPPRYISSFRNLIMHLIDKTESPRYISAVVKVRKENNSIANVYLITQ